MPLDLKTNIEQLHSENFEDYELDLLLKQSLKQFLNLDE
jgi:hypothetical protein